MRRKCFRADCRQRDDAFTWLQRAVQDRADQLIYLTADPRLDSWRSDPRFSELVHRVGIPP
jgi:hypothetical protein